MVLSWFRSAFMVVCGVIAFLAAATVTSAYNNQDNVACSLPYNYPTAYSIPWQYDSAFPVSGIYLTAYANARANWNGAAGPVYFGSQSSSTYTMGTGTFPSSNWLGITYPTCTGSMLTSTRVLLNKAFLDGTYLYAGQNYGSAFWKQYTAAHELGHSIGLGHSWYSPAIMQAAPPPASFQSGGYNGVQADDVCGMNNKYLGNTWPCGY